MKDILFSLVVVFSLIVLPFLGVEMVHAWRRPVVSALLHVERFCLIAVALLIVCGLLLSLAQLFHFFTF